MEEVGLQPGVKFGEGRERVKQRRYDLSLCLGLRGDEDRSLSPLQGSAWLSSLRAVRPRPRETIPSLLELFESNFDVRTPKALFTASIVALELWMFSLQLKSKFLLGVNMCISSSHPWWWLYVVGAQWTHPWLLHDSEGLSYTGYFMTFFPGTGISLYQCEALTVLPAPNCSCLVFIFLPLSKCVSSNGTVLHDNIYDHSFPNMFL